MARGRVDRPGVPGHDPARGASAPVIGADGCRLWRYVAEIGAGYVITGPPAENAEAAYLGRVVADYPAVCQRVMANRAVAVYRIVGNPCAGSGLGLVA